MTSRAEALSLYLSSYEEISEFIPCSIVFEWNGSQIDSLLNRSSLGEP